MNRLHRGFVSETDEFDRALVAREQAAGEIGEALPAVADDP